MFKEAFDVVMECSADAIMDFLYILGERNIEITGYTRLSTSFLIVHCKASRRDHRRFTEQYQLNTLANIIRKEKEEQDEILDT